MHNASRYVIVCVCVVGADLTACAGRPSLVGSWHGDGVHVRRTVLM